jgi:hypothetical protein
VTGSETAIIIAAATNAAGVLLGLGAVRQAINDIRDDIRGVRTDVQHCLETLIITARTGNSDKPT